MNPAGKSSARSVELPARGSQRGCEQVAPGSSARPIFIIGAPRSGTSVLTWCLGQHPNIFPLEETAWIARLSRELFVCWELGSVNGARSHLTSLGWEREYFLETFGAKINEVISESKIDRIRFGRKTALLAAGLGDKDDTDRLSRSELLALVAAERPKPLKLIRSADDPKSRWVDGTPENTFYAYGLRALFPEARFIHLLRKPGSVARSLMNFSSVDGSVHDLSEANSYAVWSRYVRHAHLIEGAFGLDSTTRLLYEELVAFPEEHLARVLSWLGEKYDPACTLPLGTVMNSSKSGAELHGGTVEERQAELLYKTVSEKTVGQQCPRAIASLEEDFLNRGAA